MVDLTKTREQLINQAADNLSLRQPGEALSSEDFDTFDNLVDPLLAQLQGEGIVYIDNDDAIDLAIFLPLAALLANQAGPSFGSPINDQAMSRDKATLTRISAQHPTYAPAVGQYY